MNLDNNKKNGDHIPNLIHYVWVGNGQKPELVLKCIDSWKKYMPDFQIIEWNESNFDVNKIAYTREAYAQKKWAFVADAIRAYVLKEYGGIYFDSDIELFNYPKDIFDNGEVVLGFDTKFLLSTGVMASVQAHPIIESLWDYYRTSHFSDSDDAMTVNTKLTYIVLDYLERRRMINNTYSLNKVKIYSKEYFSDAKSCGDEKPKYAVHHFSGSWKTKVQLTFFQYVTFFIKYKLLIILSIFMGNKTYIKINDYLWKDALKNTRNNLQKGAHIFKEL